MTSAVHCLPKPFNISRIATHENPRVLPDRLRDGQLHAFQGTLSEPGDARIGMNLYKYETLVPMGVDDDRLDLFDLQSGVRIGKQWSHGRIPYEGDRLCVCNYLRFNMRRQVIVGQVWCPGFLIVSIGSTRR